MSDGGKGSSSASGSLDASTSKGAMESPVATTSNLKEGWLEKKGAVNKNWKNRWFHLNNGQLDYYVDKDKAKKKGTIPLNDITEIGSLQHETRAFCFGLNSGKRLWVLSASTAEVREQWMSILRPFQPKQIEAGSKVPHTTIGSIKKTLLKNKKAESGSDATSSSQTAPNGGASSSSTASSSNQTPVSPRSTGAPASQAQQGASGASGNGNTSSSSGSPNGSGAPRSPPTSEGHMPLSSNPPSSPGSPPPGQGNTSASGTGGAIGSSGATSPPGSVGLNSGNSSAALSGGQGGTLMMPVVRATTQIVSNEPRATMLVPTTFAVWTPKLAWSPTPERPAWCYELAPNLPPEHTAWLSPLLSAATRFNMGWAFILDWVRRIGNTSYSDVTILENIKQGMAKLTPCWNEFDKALNLAETWDLTHTAVSQLRNQISELHGLVEAKVAGWHVQLSDKKAEDAMDFTYKRQDSGTPERPAWFFIPSDASFQVGDAFRIFERAATIFNDNWSEAYEAAKSISATNRSAAPAVKETIVKALTALEPSWKEFDNAISAFEAWNALSLYTLEVKQHVSQLKRLFETHKRDWLLHLDSRTSFVPSNKTDYVFEHDRPSTADRPAWVYKFNLSTPGEISRGLLVLSTASNIFNSNWAVAHEWANKIGKNMATRAAIREGMLGAFKNLENAWPQFESAITMLEPWETAATEVIRQVSQLRGLVEESRELWLGKLATSQEITGLNLNSDNFRLSGFGDQAFVTDSHGSQLSPPSSSSRTGGAQNGIADGSSFSSQISPFTSSSPSSSTTTSVNLTPGPSDAEVTDARVLYENALAASREAASISEDADVRLNFVPGLGPGSFRNADIYRAVLKELYKAQQLPGTFPEVLEKIRTLIVETQQRHRDLCFKWALHFAREGNMPRSIEYYEALYEVLPDAIAELDKELMQLKAEFQTAPGSVSLGTM